MKKLLMLIMITAFSIPAIADHDMKQETMEGIVKSMATSSSGEKGVVEFEFDEVSMYLISDVTHNRMRIVAPIVQYESITRAQLDATLVANYHNALDARYAVSKGVLVAVFIHPLAELHDGQIKSALRQVANLAVTFGSEYSSGSLTYGGENQGNSN